MSEAKIVWHPYPDEKPESFLRNYLVTIEVLYDKSTRTKVDIDTWSDSKEGGEWEILNNGIDFIVTAWAELPEPYNPEEPEDNHPDAITARKYAEGDPETVKALHIFDE